MFKSGLKKCTLGLIDFLALLLSLFTTILIIQLVDGHFYDFMSNTQMVMRWSMYVLLAIAYVSIVHIRYRHYTYRKPFWSEFEDLIKLTIVFSILELAMCAFFKMPFSRISWLFNWMIAFSALLFGRWVARIFLNKFGCWKKHAIIIGSGANALESYEALIAERSLGFDIVAFYPILDDFSIPNIQKIQSDEELWSLVNSKSTQIILAFDYEEQDRKEAWLKRLEHHHCSAIYLIPAIRGIPLYSTETSFLFSREIMFCRVSNKASKLSARFIKRLFDVVVSATIMILLSPILLYLAYKVSRDGASPIYGHERIGRDGRKFKCLKFRSMVINSQEVLNDLLANDPQAREEWEKDFKLKNDPRITKIGHFLRKTSLDELPQLWNVFKGEMSLVGPRPVVEEELLRYGEDVDYYLKVKPGMTGLWQVSGRSDTSYEMRVYFDAWYVKNWSIWNDIVILFKTVGVVLKSDGAY